MGKAEHHVEGYLLKRVKTAGGMCMKFTSGVVGVPDRIVILGGATLFVETKSAVGRTSAIQDVRIAQMRKAGADVRVINSREMVDELVDDLVANGPGPVEGLRQAYVLAAQGSTQRSLVDAADALIESLALRTGLDLDIEQTPTRATDKKV